ncbi:MAG TPA: CoA ester lyase [Candidatus Acidoferrales bacterium]|nr:CoA ester lyase [Candidatus Acidoferrales bacterium]
MPDPALDPSFLLFVPGDRPSRFEGAVSSGASGAVFDLEDAVSADRKQLARDAVAGYLDSEPDPSHVAVRINALGSPWFDEDLRMLRARRVGAIVVPKVPAPSVLDTVADALPPFPLIALIESASGVLHAASIAAHPRCAALAFGPFDLAADIGGSGEWDAMLAHRSHILLAARVHRKLAVDGPTIVFADPARAESDARASMRLGFDGKLLIHPSQVGPVRHAFRPSEAEISHAIRVIEAAKRSVPAVLDGVMIDGPLLLAAQRVIRRAKATAS